MAGFRVQRLVSRDPRGTIGYRTIAAGPHRVRLALLRGGGSKAVALLHPIGERRNPESLAELEDDLDWARRAVQGAEYQTRYGSRRDSVQSRARRDLEKARADVARLERALAARRAAAKSAAGKRAAKQGRAAAAGQLRLFNPRRLRADERLTRRKRG